ncbi:MAG: DUF502 domain-containing protein [Burkholderiaceae bacterium]|jgi:uncharacterized membrane protein|nr:DUF502 domain-containing protein [Burkholderiaceae bacterium]
MLKRFFITGLLIWVPLGITYWVISTIVKTLDGIIPPHIAPQALFGLDIPGFGLLAVVLVVLVTGALGANLLGRRLVDLWEGLLARIPLVRSIYSSVKQVSDTILAPNGQAFRQAVLVQYPRQGLWTIAFITGKPSHEIEHKLPADCVSIYVPTTPNPTSGFFLMLPRAELIPLSIGVDAALKYVVSMGTVPPSAQAKPKADK